MKSPLQLLVRGTTAAPVKICSRTLVVGRGQGDDAVRWRPGLVLSRFTDAHAEYVDTPPWPLVKGNYTVVISNEDHTSDGVPWLLSDEMRASGEWIAGDVAALRLGRSLRTLEGARQSGKVRAVPAVRGSTGSPRQFWYAAADIDEWVARIRTGTTTQKARRVRRKPRNGDDGHLLRELELSMARAEAKEQELARVRAEHRTEIVDLQGQLRAARADIARLERDVRRLAALVQLSVQDLVTDV